MSSRLLRSHANLLYQSQSASDDDETDAEDYEALDEATYNIRHQSVKRALAYLYEDDDDSRFNFGARSDIDPVTLHPTQVDIIRIWQIYLDNVNPLLKVTHTPTLQTRIIEAAADLQSVSATMHALMFGIYCVAMLTISDEDCIAVFGTKCGDLLKKFQLGCRQALLRCNILRTNDRNCLTAFYLYLVRNIPIHLHDSASKLRHLWLVLLFSWYGLDVLQSTLFRSVLLLMKDF